MNKLRTSLALFTVLSLLVCTACSGDDRQAQREAEQNGVSVVTVAATQTTTQATTKATTTTIATTAATTAKATEKPTEPPTEAPTEPVTTKKESKAYNSGMYKVGKDIPEGEYILFNTSDVGAYMCVSSDANGDDITFNENFDSDLIITVYEDEYLELSRCMAIDLDELTEGNEDKAKNLLDALPYGTDQGAMYKVGLMLEPGEYKIEATSSVGGYYCIYSDSRHDDIIANDNFHTSRYIDVSDGEYLLLSRCKIVE